MAFTMQAPPAVRSKIYPIAAMNAGRARELSKKLAALSGVKEVVVIPEEWVAYLKVDMQHWDEQGVLSLLETSKQQVLKDAIV